MSSKPSLTTIKSKWTSACAANGCRDGDSGVELTWHGIVMAELFVGPKGIILTPLYKFHNELTLAIMAFPKADKHFDTLISNVKILEKICNLWEAAVPDVDTPSVSLKYQGRDFGSINFVNGTVTFMASTGNGMSSSTNPDTMIKYSNYIRESSRKVEAMDDMMLIDSLGKNIIQRETAT